MAGIRWTRLNGYKLILSDTIYTTRAWKILANAYNQKKDSSTFLLYGQDGIGRWVYAISFAALLNCEQPVEEENGTQPCGACRNCMNIFHLNFDGLKIAVPIPPHENKLENAIDLTNEYLETKKEEPYAILTSTRSTNIPIALAREIKKNLSLLSVKNQVRIVIFYQMEKMNKASADALLKMIEEPPERTVIILIADKPDSLLPTIQSRAQKIKIPENSPERIKEYLLEHYEVTENRADLLSKISEGSIGRAIEMLDVDTDDELSKRSVYFLIFKSLFLESGADTLSHMNDLLSLRDKSEILRLLLLWQLLIRDCANYSVTNNTDDIINIDFSTEIAKLAVYFQTAQLAAEMAEAIKITLADLERNVHIQGSLMALGLKLRSSIRSTQN